MYDALPSALLEFFGKELYFGYRFPGGTKE
jgi:hypothetical protein